MITPQLPWPHDLLATVQDKDHWLVVTHREHTVHPYTLHRCNQRGECFYGHYFKTLQAAYNALAERIRHED